MKDLISAITTQPQKAESKIPENIDIPATPEIKIKPATVPDPVTETKVVTPEDLLAGVPGIGTGEAPPLQPGDTTPEGEIKRGRGRPKGSRNKPLFDDVKEATKPQVDYSIMANMTFDMGTGLLANVFGPEWLPAPSPKEGIPGERDVVVASLKTYLESKQVQDLPPGLMLTVVVCAYALPRFQQPTTSGKVKMGWIWLKAKVGGFFAKKKKVVISTVPTTTA